jgi:glycosyltransferase involved in cell wall biosynthesis
MPPGRTLVELDRIAAEVNDGVAVEIPTSVGFCMLISRACLEAVGLFDEEAFGRGYGEENDFSLRAAAKGFAHLLATDVFVKHVGEVSFAESSSEGKRNATRIILERYPDYSQIVARHVGLDPALVARLRLTFALWKSDGKPIIALVTHDIGGGTERQVSEIFESLDATHHVVIIKPAAGSATKLYLENRSGFDGFDLSINITNGLQFAQLLRLIGVESVQLHHLYGHGPNVRSGLAIAGVEFEFHVHDFYTLCPQITMTTERHEYCGEPDAEGCNACIAKRPTHGATDIANWRSYHEWAVLGASSVVAPSRDAAARIQHYLGVPSEVRYHETAPIIPVPGLRTRRIDRAHPLRVVMIGVLAEHKGKHKVLDAIAAAAASDLPLHFHLVGYLGLTDGQMSDAMAARFSSTGWYKEHDLPKLIEEAEADVFLFASTAPETYSFTLTSAMKTGRPIVAPAHGAYPERLETYPHSQLFPVGISGEDLASLLLDVSGAAVKRESPAHAHD